MKTCIALLVLLPGALMAANNVTYTATAAPSANPDASKSTGGTADVWSVTLPSGTGDWFNTGSVPNSWVTYSTNAATQPTLSTHTFEGGALVTGQILKLDLALEFVATGKRVGINLISNSQTVFSLYFEGGNAGGVWRYTDSLNNGLSTGVAWGFDAWNTFVFTKTATGYTASFGGQPSFSGTLAGESIDTITVFNDAESSGNNSFYFRTLQLTGVPEPSSYGLAIGAMALALVLKRRIRGNA